MDVVLAITYHDPQGRLYDQIESMLPALIRIFGGLAVEASHATDEKSLALFAAAGARVRQEAPHAVVELGLGHARRGAVSLALQLNLPFVMYCDGDRVLHWAECYLQELAQVAARIPECDLTVLGRTPRAFDSHPRIQRDTEVLVNHVFGLVSGEAWDVTAAARGLSRRAAEAILAGCPDEAISTDVSWPLFLRQAGGFSLGYIETEGLEFETADRYGDEVTTAGGRAQWLAQLDADPRRWAHRLNMARVEVEAMLPYAPHQLPPQAGGARGEAVGGLRSA